MRTALVVGVERFAAELRALGFTRVVENGDYYGPAIALGSVEVTLWEIVNAYRALFSDERTVEASSRSPQVMRMTWRTDAVHVAAVADQVARQLELGYNRVQPHNALFEGFTDP